MKPRLLSIVALLSVLLIPNGARAMEIYEFAKMSNDDEAGYIAFLVEASAKMLKGSGQPDQSAKLLAFFSQPGRKGGAQQLAANLESADAMNKRHAINPNNRAPKIQVEDAMSSTFKDAGITVPVSFLLNAGKDFKPSGPPRPRGL